MGPEGLNPLHCGAVVASHAAVTAAAPSPPVSIPFIAGQWSLLAQACCSALRRRRVSIPFIAGQWSLRARAKEESMTDRYVSIPFIAGQWSLLHLHADYDARR